jgi:uncharacterized protein
MDYVQLINDQIKSAMIAKETLRLETLRSIRAGIIEFEKNGSGKSLDEEAFLKIVQTGAKKRKDSIAQYESANRPELAEKEKTELAILMEFMPQQMSEEEVRATVQAIAVEVGATTQADFPKLIGAVMKQLKGKADGSLIQQTVKSILG